MTTNRTRVLYLAIPFGFGLAIAGTVGAQELPASPALVTSPLPFIGITPCRLVDTRDPSMPPGYGPPSLTAGIPNSYTVTGRCGIPAGAQVVSLNVTAVNPQGVGFLTLFPQGTGLPIVSTLNFVQNKTTANAAIVPLNAGGLSVVAGVSGTDLILDVNGYFACTSADISNAFLGLGAGNPIMTGQYNTGLGWGALGANTTGQKNTAVGYRALASNTDGNENTAVGVGALASNTTGNYNSALGSGALASNTTGSRNTAVGYGALVLNTDGSDNIAVGAYAGSNLTSGQGNIYLGATGPASESFTIRIGEPGLHNRCFITGAYFTTTAVPDAVPVYVDSTGKLGNVVSSARYKEDIRDMGDKSEALAKLRPVTFHYKDDADLRVQFGLIAEEVEDVYPELVVHDRAGNTETVMYHELPAMLLNEWQKQRKELARQEEEGRALEMEAENVRAEARQRQARIEELAARIAELERSRP
jgi:hypothetical protein